MRYVLLLLSFSTLQVAIASAVPHGSSLTRLITLANLFPPESLRKISSLAAMRQELRIETSPFIVPALEFIQLVEDRLKLRDTEVNPTSHFDVQLHQLALYRHYNSEAPSNPLEEQEQALAQRVLAIAQADHEMAPGEFDALLWGWRRTYNFLLKHIVCTAVQGVKGEQYKQLIRRYMELADALELLEQGRQKTSEQEKIYVEQQQDFLEIQNLLTIYWPQAAEELSVVTQMERLREVSRTAKTEAFRVQEVQSKFLKDRIMKVVDHDRQVQIIDSEKDHEQISELLEQYRGGTSKALREVLQQLYKRLSILFARRSFSHELHECFSPSAIMGIVADPAGEASRRLFPRLVTEMARLLESDEVEDFKRLAEDFLSAGKHKPFLLHIFSTTNILLERIANFLMRIDVAQEISDFRKVFTKDAEEDEHDSEIARLRVLSEALTIKLGADVARPVSIELAQLQKNLGALRNERRALFNLDCDYGDYFSLVLTKMRKDGYPVAAVQGKEFSEYFMVQSFAHLVEQENLTEFPKEWHHFSEEVLAFSAQWKPLKANYQLLDAISQCLLKLAPQLTKGNYEYWEVSIRKALPILLGFPEILDANIAISKLLQEAKVSVEEMLVVKLVWEKMAAHFIKKAVVPNLPQLLLNTPFRCGNPIQTELRACLLREVLGVTPILRVNAQVHAPLLHHHSFRTSLSRMLTALYDISEESEDLTGVDWGILGWASEAEKDSIRNIFQRVMNISRHIHNQRVLEQIVALQPLSEEQLRVAAQFLVDPSSSIVGREIITMGLQSHAGLSADLPGYTHLLGQLHDEGTISFVDTRVLGSGTQSLRQVKAMLAGPKDYSRGVEVCFHELAKQIMHGKLSETYSSAIEKNLNECVKDFLAILQKAIQAKASEGELPGLRKIFDLKSGRS